MYRMVFTQVFCRLIIVAVVVLFSSCSSFREFQIEVLHPSKIDLEESRRIALLYRNTHLENNPIVFADKLTELRAIDDFEKGLNHVFMDISYDTIRSFFIAKERHTTKTHLLPLPTDSIRSWCKQFDVDYIISLEMIHYKIQNSLIDCNWFIRLYKSDKDLPIDSILLKHTLPEDTYYYHASGDILLEDIRVSYWDKGVEYARHISPFWSKTERRVYDWGGVVGMGDVLLQNGNIEGAINIWTAVSKSSNKKAIKSSINLAWVYENSGDFDKALEFLLHAEEIAKQKKMNNKLTKYLQEYLQKIKQRIAHREILNRQIISIEN